MREPEGNLESRQSRIRGGPHQPLVAAAHLNPMKAVNLRSLYFAALAVLHWLQFQAVQTTKNNLTVRERTAQATETVRRDAKAVAEGLKEAPEQR